MDDEEIKGAVLIVGKAIRYARTGERLRNTLVTLTHALSDIASVRDLEDEIGPELIAALDHINEAAAALGRAATFLDTRFSLDLEGELPPSEGGQAP